MTVDLHIHTNLSDGQLDLNDKNVVDIFKNYDLVSITDHDVIFDHRKYEYINACSKTKFITGVEICCNFNGYNMELLAYNFDPNNKKLNEVCKEIVKIRYEGMKETLLSFNQDVSNLKENPFQTNITLSDDLQLETFLNTYVGGLKTMTYQKNNAKDIIKYIKDAGGIVVLAHPYETLRGETKNTVEDFIMDLGVNIIELYTTKHDTNEINILFDIIKNKKLFASIGSDSHFLPLENLGKNIDFNDEIFKWMKAFI